MNEVWRCVDCGNSWEQAVHSPKTPCPTCGSRRRAADVSAEDHEKEIEEARLKVRHGQKGPYFFEAKAGDSFSHDRQKWVYRGYIVDREDDDYHERIVDPDTGEVIFEKRHRLSEHRDRGSAKKVVREPPTSSV